jgi:hypothetical protein
MSNKKGLDACDWCDSESNSIQTNGSIWLCPSCCPSVDEGVVPEDAPASWYHMSNDEREDWKDGMSMEDIVEKYSWYIPPSPPADLVH